MARNSKTKTYDQILAMQAKAVRFLRNVVGDEDKADEIEGLSPDEYAERKGITIVEENPSLFHHARSRRADMTRLQLEERVAQLEEENEDLQSRLDSIMDIVQPEDAHDDGDDEDDDEDEDGDDSDDDEDCDDEGGYR